MTPQSPRYRSRSSTPVWPVECAARTVDAVVGSTAADFLAGDGPEARRKAPPVRNIERPSFAEEISRFLEPVRDRYVEEAIRLDWVTDAAVDYARTPRLPAGSADA